MKPSEAPSNEARLKWSAVILLTLGAVASFQLAYIFPRCAFLMAVYLGCLFQLTALPSPRGAFWLGILIGFLTFAPLLNFIWTIFGPAAIALWFVISFWVGLFLFLAQRCRANFKTPLAVLLIPFLWTGLEYFRSELYYLRFSWANAGYAFARNPGGLPFHLLGVYGIGFMILALIAICSLLPGRIKWLAGVALLTAFGIMSNLPAKNSAVSTNSSHELQVAGVQLEFPNEPQVIFSLDQLIKKYPDAQLFVLSEYTFSGPVPKQIFDWCHKHHRYLIVGGEDPISDTQYYNTAFVISPDGEIVFRQAKSAPIQFFKDGLPAPKQAVWNSPWGRLGVCICYDLSYTRVTDTLVRDGAEALIVPTMDVSDWGAHQHALHALVAPVRAAEYHLPIFRLASSGISQCVTADGQVTATAPMPGDGAMLSGTLLLGQPGTVPWDRPLAKVCVGVTVVIILQLILKRRHKTKHPSQPIQP